MNWNLLPLLAQASGAPAPASPSGFDKSDLFSLGNLAIAGRVVALLVLGFVGVTFLARWVNKTILYRLTRQQQLIFEKVITWGGNTLVALMALQQLGFQVGAILGAAGVLGVAIGFAAQTSTSNLISGLFLIFEQPFEVGDVVTVGGTTGEILSIDLLSVKIRKFDNAYVRIPNETILKDQVVNVTRFPIRRVDINVSIEYSESLDAARAVLLRLANEHPLVLMQPEPLVAYTGFAASSLDILFGVWVERADYLAVKNSMIEQIRVAFEKEGIEMPFPHTSLHVVEGTAPFPVRILTDSTPPSPVSPHPPA